MRTFADELRSLGKRRVRLPDLRASYLRAHPEARDAPDLRRMLLEALRALEGDGLVELPNRGWDSSGVPALPRTVGVLHAVEPRRFDAPQAWLPELAFAAHERHPTRRADLKAINTYLVSARGRDLVFVPTSERSLQIFGDEKRLDQLRKGASTLFDGRVSLDDLGCFPVAPPLPFETPARRAVGQPILVLENHHSFESFRRWNHKVAAYAAIAYGGGNAFRQGAGNLDDLIARTGADGAIYLGDLDPAGVRILMGVNATRAAESRMPLRPHRGLYRWLLMHGCRCPMDTALPAALANGITELFSKDIVDGFLDLWATGERIPQESFGLEQLSDAGAAIAGPDGA